MRGISLSLMGMMLICGSVDAADTIETWEAGAGNFEMYSGFEGVGSSTSDQAFASAMLMGWGVANRFSAFVGVSLTADGYFASAESELGLGAFATLYDSDHLDFDLGLDMVVSGPGMNEAVMVPGFEINLDRTPDLSSFGLYLRGAAPIAGGKYDDDEIRRHVDLRFTAGTYFTLSPTQQILLQYDITVHDEPEPGVPDVERGALALGYNAILNDSLELISEAWLDVPQGDESYHLGLMVGVIATLFPGGG